MTAPPSAPTARDADRLVHHASTSAAALVRVLRGHGVDRVFCVAGESYLAVLDELYAEPGIDVVTCRHESSAGFAAIADAKLVERVGICMVSRGPGATNASIAIHAAAEDATPLVLIVGQVTRAELGQQAFQEIDCHAVFSSMAKGVWTVLDPAATAAMLIHAIRVAESGTPGPVVLVLPEDVLTESVPLEPRLVARAEISAEPSEHELRQAADLLSQAERPLLLAGGTLATARGRRWLQEAAELLDVPVITSNKRQDLLDNRHRCYAGHLHNNTQPDQLAEFRRADLVLAVGTRLDATTTHGGVFPAACEPAQSLVHVHPDPSRLGGRHHPTLAIACDPGKFLSGLAEHTRWGNGVDRSRRSGWIAELHAWEERKAIWHEHESDDGIPFGAVIAELDHLTGGEVTITLDSGTFTSWLYRYLRVSRAGRMLGVTSSAMGFGVPAGVAAAMRCDHPVVAIVGDGGFGMTGSELATAVARRLPLVVVIANNSSYATIRVHQEKHYPHRVIATDLVNPDFARLAEAYGALGLSVTDPAEIPHALGRALSCGGPAVLDVHTSLNWISAYRNSRLRGVAVPA
jgi:acetolactate synthase-1/2/3 large subunit